MPTDSSVGDASSPWFQQERACQNWENLVEMYHLARWHLFKKHKRASKNWQNLAKKYQLVSWLRPLWGTLGNYLNALKPKPVKLK
jgi:hypothetical protein